MRVGQPVRLMVQDEDGNNPEQVVGEIVSVQHGMDDLELSCRFIIVVDGRGEWEIYCPCKVGSLYESEG